MRTRTPKKSNSKKNGQQGKEKTKSNVYLMNEKEMTQAIIKAYEIIEEKKKSEEVIIEIQKDNSKEITRGKWWINALFMFNVLLFPWKINKKFTINNQIYDSILVLFVSLILVFSGATIWLAGMGTIVYGIVLSCQGTTVAILTGMLVIGYMPIRQV